MNLPKDVKPTISSEYLVDIPYAETPKDSRTSVTLGIARAPDGSFTGKPRTVYPYRYIAMEGNIKVTDAMARKTTSNVQGHRTHNVFVSLSQS
ncbi:hypothetical protein PGTUg99_017374 [Puccinia graminis f. sp. tritici]|uniref:Uncharacterized protein n=1 Tax=Puccinia graminis f. sp. tritici TaxID=56615 RepID=A0A5B0RJH0_PUCGR|nr:hypothetical protein PGTUg99_017374 [Puccinia graminis f. sp. tritici]